MKYANFTGGKMHQKIGLYLHIPYCVQKCRYCDFLSFAGRYGTDGKMYFNALREELRSLADSFGRESGCRIGSVFIGGGTPSVAESREIAETVELVRRVFYVEKNAEITVEANPGTVTREKLNAFYRAGINRLSLGVQSLDDGVLKAMGRIHSAHEAEQAYDMARSAGFQNINMDLILGFPGQSLSVFTETLKKAVALRPEHISAYSLIVEEGTPLFADIRGGLVPEPEQDADREMYHSACRFLREAGYVRYEISNFARPGYESRHNKGYWTGVYYLGAGLGAASYLPGERFKNTEDMRAYLERPPDQKRDRDFDEFLSLKDEMNEFMMLGFRLAEGPDEGAFAFKFKMPYTQVYRTQLRKLLEQGLIEKSAAGYCLSAKGLDFGNLVFEEFV